MSFLFYFYTYSVFYFFHIFSEVYCSVRARSVQVRLIFKDKLKLILELDHSTKLYQEPGVVWLDFCWKGDE